MSQFSWKAEFADPKMEQDFFDKNSRNIKRGIQYICIITALAYLLSSIADYYELGYGDDFKIMLLGRASMAFFGILTFFIFESARAATAVKKFAFGFFMSITILCESLEVYIKSPLFNSMGIPVTAFIVLAFYLFLPPWIMPSLIAAVGGSIIFMLTAIFATDSGTSAILINLFCFMLINAFGCYFLYNFNVNRRRDFKTHQELKLMAEIDDLTKVLCRRRVMELGEYSLSLAERCKNPFSVLILDIDYFKKINDTYGHHVGDQVLKDLARICKEEIREIDLIGRIGGEEFVIILPHTDAQQAAVVAARICNSVEMYEYPDDDKDIRVTMSIGTAVQTGPGNLRSLLKKADQALYEAKKTGGIRSANLHLNIRDETLKANVPPEIFEKKILSPSRME